MKTQMYYKIFEEVKLVKGYYRGIAYDLHRNNYDFLPNELIDVLIKQNGKSLRTLKKNLLEICTEATYKEYLDFLLKKEYIFLIDKKYISLFQTLNQHWELPSLIYSAIIDVKNPELFLKNKVIEQLEEIGCKHLLLRFNDLNTLSLINQFILNYKNSGFHSIQIWINMKQKTFKNSDLKKICIENPKVTNMSFFNCPTQSTKSQIRIFNEVTIKIYNGIWQDSDDCLVQQSHFKINISNFIESTHYNNYFYQKIFIDDNGFIRNAPLCSSQGNVSNTLIKSILTPDFKKYWFSNKDNTIVCKDCEYRYMCIDSRIPKEINKEFWGHNNNCNYNPYICKWKDENKYVSIEECGNYFKEIGFVPDHEKIRALNEQIWGKDDE